MTETNSELLKKLKKAKKFLTTRNHAIKQRREALAKNAEAAALAEDADREMGLDRPWKE